MYRVRHCHIKFWTGDAAWRRKIDLLESLFDKPLLGSVFRDLRCLSQFFDGRGPFLVVLGAVVDFSQLGVHHITSGKL